MNKYIVVTCIILLSACTFQAGQRGNSSIDCKRVKKQCRLTQAYYDEWYRTNGDLACNCVDL